MTLINSATPVQFGDSSTADRAVIVQYGSGTDASGRAPAVVSLRAVDQDGRLRTGALAKSAPLSNVASAAALGGDDYVVADYTGVVHRYRGTHEIATLDPGAVLRETTRPALVALHHDHLALVIGTSVAIIDTSNGKLRKAHVINDSAHFSAVAAFPGGAKIAAAMGDRSLRIYDVATGKQVDHTMTDVLSATLAVSPDEKVIALVDALTGVVSLLDTKTLPAVGPRPRGARVRHRPHVPRQRQAAGHQFHRRHRALLGPRRAQADRRPPARKQGRGGVRRR